MATSTVGWALTRRTSRAIDAASLALLATAAGSFVGGLIWPHAPLLGLACMATLVVLWPLRNARGPEEIASPWGFVVAAVLVGVLAQTAFLVLGIASDDAYDHLMLHRLPGEFVLPGALLVMGLTAMALGWLHPPRMRGTTALREWVAGFTLPSRGVHVVAVLLAAAGLFGFLQFVEATGGLDLLRPSAKREGQWVGPLRALSGLSDIAFLLMLTHYTLQRRMRIRHVLFLGVLFANACLLPFYGSTRADILWLLLAALVAAFYAGGRIRPVHVAAVALMIVATVHVMGVLRSGEAVTAIRGSESSEFVESVVLSRNLVGIPKTAHVVNAIPGTLDWRYGGTYATWLVAPIPRDLWPDKPVLQAGNDVGTQVFGHRAAGVPPGLIAELYWNFHVPGVLFGGFLFGWLLRVLHVKLCPRHSRSPALILVYAVSVMRLGMGALNGTLGQAAFNAALDAAVIIAVLWFLAVTRRSARHASARHAL